MMCYRTVIPFFLPDADIRYNDEVSYVQMQNTSERESMKLAINIDNPSVFSGYSVASYGISNQSRGQ